MARSIFGGILSPSEISNDRHYVHSKVFSKQNNNQNGFNYFDQDIIINWNISKGDLFTMIGNHDTGDFMSNALFNSNNIIQRAIFVYFNQGHASELLATLCIIGLLLIVILVIYYRKIKRKNRRTTSHSLDLPVHKEETHNDILTFKHIEAKQPEFYV